MSMTVLGNHRTAGALPLSDDKAKEEDFSVATGEERPEIASLDTLPTELLSIILNYATQEGRDGQFLCNLRKVCTRWRDVIDMTILISRWENLPKEIQHPILRPIVDRLLLVDHVTTDIISSAWGSLEEDSDSVSRHDLVDRVRALGPSAFNRFSSLSQKMTGSPAFLGFDGRSYDAIRGELDRSLGLLWDKCHRFDSNAVRPGGALLQQWFTDLDYSHARDRVDDLRFNEKIRMLPPEIGQFARLTSLNLTDHLLAILPDAIGSLSQLKTLCLDNNHLTSLPETIGNLDQLEMLSVCNNLLISLPKVIGGLIRLNVLELDGNQLTTLPASLANLVAHPRTMLQTAPRFQRNPLIFLLDNQFKEKDGPLYMVTQFGRNAPIIVSGKETFAEKYQSCLSYMCLTPLASLCQEVHRGSCEVALRSAFESLSKDGKERIERAWQAAAGSSLRGSLEPGQDVLANRGEFVKAVIVSMREKFLASSKKHDQIYRYCAAKKLWKNLSSFERSNPRNSVQRGRDSADRNILLLIDAMELETAETELKEQL